MRTFSVWTLLFCLISVFISSCNNYGGELVHNAPIPQTFTIEVSASADKSLRVEVDGKVLGNPSSTINIKDTLEFVKGKSKEVKVFVEGKEKPVVVKHSSKEKAEDLILNLGSYFSFPPIEGFVSSDGVNPLDELGLTPEEGKVKVRVIANSSINKYQEPVDFQFFYWYSKIEGESFNWHFKWVGERYKGYQFGSGLSDVITFSLPTEEELDNLNLGIGILRSGTDEGYLIGSQQLIPADDSIEPSEGDYYGSVFAYDTSGVTLTRLSDIPYREGQPRSEVFLRDVVVIDELLPTEQLMQGLQGWSCVSIGEEIIKLKQEQESPKTE